LNRPSNYSPPLIPDGSMGPDSPLTVPPRYIRIAIRASGPNGMPIPGAPVLRVEQVEMEYYVKNVLPNEWLPMWNAEAYKAGAEAIREFAWYWVNHGGKYPQYGADLDNSTESQVYKAGTGNNFTDSAVDAIWSQGWKKNGVIFQSHYCAGTPGSPAANCSFGGMTQYGSQYLASVQGMNYQSILNYYYNSPSPPIVYFTLPPQVPKTYAITNSPTHSSFSLTSPGGTYYNVIKLVNGNWVTIFSGPGPSQGIGFIGVPYQNAATRYAVAAYNAAGWTPYTFNTGQISNGPGILSVNAPATWAYPGGNRVRLTYKTTGAISYSVLKWIGSQWVSVYSGTNPEYVDLNLTPNTDYYYAAAAYKPTGGWTPYSNNYGWLNARTYSGQ